SQIEDQGNIEPEVVENIANSLTRADTKDTAPHPDAVGETAMDAGAMQAILHGDYQKVKDFESDYNGSAAAMAVRGGQTARDLAQQVGGGSNVRLACKGLLIAAWTALGVQAAACAGPQLA